MAKKPKLDPGAAPPEPEQTQTPAEQTPPDPEQTDAEFAEGVAKVLADQAPTPKSEAMSEDMLRRMGMEREALIMATKTLSGDLRDFVLDTLRYEKSALPWNVRPEAEQRQVVERVTKLAINWTSRAVRLVAGAGRQVMAGKLIKVNVKDALQAQVDFLRSDPLRHDLMDVVGQEVLLVVSDRDAFMGERTFVPIREDQPELFQGEAEKPSDRNLDGTEVTAKEAAELGADAFLAGQDVSECPFPAGSNAALCWTDGYNEARDNAGDNNEGSLNV